jgi:transposase
MHDIIPMVRRVVGLDLGIATAHTAVVLDEAGSIVAKRRVVPTVASFTDLEQAALEGAPAGTRLEIVIEPTGPAWLPVAVWFTGRGHTVFRVSTQKAADLRRFLSRHTKTNTIDAHTLARLPMIDPDGLHPVALPTTQHRAALDRRVRACARLTREIGERKVRIIGLARQLIPTIGEVLSKKLSRADLAVLERYPDPRRLATVRRDRLVGLITKASNGHATAQAKADGFRTAARAAVELYGDTDAVAFDVLADEIVTEIRLLRAAETERDRHDQAREDNYLAVDPEQLARTLPGIGTVGAPMLIAVMGDPDRFADAAAFKAYLGLAPKASETGETDRKGQPMSKAGNRDLRTQLIRSAETARREDPQLAAVYYDQMVNKGAVHIKALCVVAAKLAERAWTTLHRHSPYELRDVDGTPLDHATAKQLIAERYTVPEHVRRQRRSKKSGKAPHNGQTRQRRSTRRPSHQTASRPTPPHVKNQTRPLTPEAT